MEFDVRVLDDAGADVERVIVYLTERWGHEAATRWAQEFDALIDRLGHLPLRFPRAGLESDLWRELRIAILGRGKNQFAVSFAVEGQVVYILRVRHTARSINDEIFGG